MRVVFDHKDPSPPPVFVKGKLYIPNANPTLVYLYTDASVLVHLTSGTTVPSTQQRSQWTEVDATLTVYR